MRPNVLLFIPHDLGDHLGCYGHTSVKSPNLDKLADEGVRFTNYFATAPECTPSRAGLYTGLYIHQTGLMGLCHRGWEFKPDAVHLAQHLWRGGYQTYLFGFQHETAGSPARLGYNRIYSQQDISCEAVCGEVVEFLERKAPYEANPWFACAGFSHVHRPWSEKTSFLPEDIQVPPYLPDNPEVRLDLAQFHQSIADMDMAVGRVLQALHKSRLMENTVVIFTTDHGIPFPRAKSTFYDPGIRTALLIRWPAHIKGGAVYEQLISNLDFCPTMLEICRVQVPQKLEGRSFLPVLEYRNYTVREAVFGALYYDAFYDPMHYVRTRNYKYIRSFAVTPEDAASADPSVIAGHKTGIWIRADDTDVQSSRSWKSMRGPFVPPPREELYDLKADPLEQSNLINDIKYREVFTDLRVRMLQMMERTQSPLLKGHVSPELSRSRNTPCK